MLIKCHACDKEISSNAPACPHCGEPMKSPAEAGNPGGVNMSDPVHFVGMMVVGLMVIGIIVMFIKGCS